MLDMEKQNFEDSWKDAFADAEVSPNSNVWRNIELDLERAKGAALRKRLVFYQLLAAASVTIALLVGIGMYFNTNQFGASDLTAQKQTSNPDEVDNNQSPASSELSKTIVDKQNNVDRSNVDDQSTKTDNNQSLIATNQSNESTHIAVQTQTSQEGLKSSKSSRLNGSVTLAENKQRGIPGLPYDEQAVVSVFNPPLPGLVNQPKAKLPAHTMQPQSTEIDPVTAMLARLELMELELSETKNKKEKESKGEKLWTSVGFATGSFNSKNAGVTSSADNYAMVANKATAEKEAQASGSTYSFGMNVGTRVSNRWVVQGGVNYLTQSSDYTANTAVGSSDLSSFLPQSINELEKLNASGPADERKLINTSPYNVNNNIRYLSIPMQAGYLLMNRDFGVQLNAGVSTDLFLQNTVTAEGENLSETKQRIGDDSPYRALNLSGLLGTEVSYRFGERYRLALNPGLRYPFSSIYRSGVDVKASPLTLDIGLKFRYIFK
jgi:hypothetical protein